MFIILEKIKKLYDLSLKYRLLIYRNTIFHTIRLLKYAVLLEVASINHESLFIQHIIRLEIRVNCSIYH